MRICVGNGTTVKSKTEGNQEWSFKCEAFFFLFIFLCVKLFIEAVRINESKRP